MLGRVAAALKTSFIKRIETRAGVNQITGRPYTFAETGVVLPDDEVWENYAIAAVSAMREPTKEMLDAVCADSRDYFGGETEELYTAMIDRALE